MSQRLRPRNPLNPSGIGLGELSRYMPVTLCMMLISAVVAAVTMFGKHLDRVDRLFMASQKAVAEYREIWDEYHKVIESQGYEPDGKFYVPTERTRKVPRAEGERLERLVAAVKAAEARMKDPLADVRRGQIWRVVTPVFLHFGILHLVFNMSWLWAFGQVLEMRLRPLRFLALVLLVAVVSNLAQAWWGGTSFGGMSGVNYGLFGFLLLRAKLHPSPDFVMESRTVVLMLVWLVVCFTGAVGPIANAAHLVGFLSGGALGATHALQSGGLQVMRRRREFRSALGSGPDCLHRCAVCGRTERSHPELDFFVSRTDGHDYCTEHLPEHRAGGAADG